MYYLETHGMPSKHIDKDSWDAIENLKKTITEKTHLINESELLKMIIREGVEAVKEKEKEEKRAG